MVRPCGFFQLSFPELRFENSYVAVAVMLLIVSCTYHEIPQGTIPSLPTVIMVGRCSSCEENHYAEAELILKEGVLVAKQVIISLNYRNVKERVTWGTNSERYHPENAIMNCSH